MRRRDPDARQRQLLKNFFAAWDKSGSQIEAAQQAFGDLKHFGQVIEGYSRQTMFRAALFKNGQQAADKTYSVRTLPPGEVLALRGDCAAHRNKLEQARPLVEQAVQAEPGLAISHEVLGYYLYRKEDQISADKEMKKAMELGSTSFVPPYYSGMMLLRGGLGSAATRDVRFSETCAGDCGRRVENEVIGRLDFKFSAGVRTGGNRNFSVRISSAKGEGCCCRRGGSGKQSDHGD